MQLKTILLIGLGFIFLVLGAIGLLLPLWPTTPFVLVSAACFSSTPRLKEKIMRIPFFKEYIESYEQKIGLSRKTVVKSIGWLWCTLLLSMFLTRKVWISLLLVIVGTAVSSHILYISKCRK